jgi:4-hydroxybenzoate polyprenyltransferase
LNFIIEKAKGWMALARLPNLFTVPGDCICGFLLAGGRSFDRSFALVCASSLSCYIFGLICNDIRDVEEDRISSPWRPLPSGRISIGEAKVAAILMLVSGLGLGFAAHPRCGLICAALLSCIVLYDFVFKSNGVIGPLLLASCRGLNVILGASYFGIPGSLPELLSTLHFTILYSAYVFGVSVEARDERSAEKSGLITGACVAGLSLVLLSGYFAARMLFVSRRTGMLPPALFIGLAGFLPLSLIFVVFLKNRIAAGNSDTSAEIGRLICGMLLFQAVYLSAAGLLAGAWTLLLLFLLAAAAGFFFKGS